MIHGLMDLFIILLKLIKNINIMKNLKVTFVFLCISMLHSHAQDNILYQGIQQAKSSGVTFETFSVFTPVSRGASHSERFQENFVNPQEVYILQFDKTVANRLDSSMTLLIPLCRENLHYKINKTIIS